LEFGNVGFLAGRKTGEPEEKPSEKGKNQQKNSTNTRLESNPGHNGGRQALSPLRQPCSNMEWATQ